MNNRITCVLAAAVAATLSCTLAHGQDARPTLTVEPLPTPALPVPQPTPNAEAVAEDATAAPTPASASGDESTVATDSAKAADEIMTTDPILTSAYNYQPPKISYERLDRKHPFGAQPPSPANGITLDQTVQAALEHNASILLQIAEIKRTRGQVVEVRAQALPQLGVSSGYNDSKSLSSNRNSSSGNGIITQTDSTSTVVPSQGQIGYVDPTLLTVNGQPLKVFGNGNNTVETKTSTTSQSIIKSQNNSFKSDNKSWNVNFQVTQLIYSGGQVSAALRAARAIEDSSFFQLRDTVDQIIAQVRQQFYLVLLNRALIGVQEESVQLLQSELRDQKNRFEAGTVPRFNVLRAEVALANAQPALIRAKNAYRTSQLRLAKLVGVTWPTTSNLTPFPVKGLLTYEPRDIDLGESVQTAMERRAFLKVQRQTILSDVEQIKVALAGYQPTVSGNAGYQFRNDSASNDLTETVDGWFFGISGSWDIFDGFATAGKVTQARARLESSRVNYEDSVRQVELEVQTTYSDLIEAREVIDSQQKTVEQAAEALRLAQERLSAGAGTQLEVLDARVSLTQAQTTALQALADYNSKLAEFDRVTGVITRYHETFDDPLASKKARKLWLANAKKKKPVLTDEEIRNNLIKRRNGTEAQ